MASQVGDIYICFKNRGMMFISERKKVGSYPISIQLIYFRLNSLCAMYKYNPLSFTATKALVL